MGFPLNFQHFTHDNFKTAAQTSTEGCVSLRCIFTFIVFLLLCGCSYAAPPGENHGPRVVTAVEVTAAAEGELSQYRYTGEEKIRAVLHYLRRAKPDRSVPITPDTFRTDAYRITLHLSDGTKSVYHQLYSDYLQKENGRWHSIDSTHGSALARLLQELPPDA